MSRNEIVLSIVAAAAGAILMINKFVEVANPPPSPVVVQPAVPSPIPPKCDGPIPIVCPYCRNRVDVLPQRAGQVGELGDVAAEEPAK